MILSLPVHKVGGAINRIDNPGGSIRQTTLFACSDGFFSDKAVVEEGDDRVSKESIN